MAGGCTVEFNLLDDWAQTAEGRVRAACMNAAQRTAARAQILMSEPKHGRIYARGGRQHRASAPGEAPAVDTGYLKNSMQVKAIGPTEVEVGVTAEYAAKLEFGGAHVAPRPYMAPSVEQEKQKFFEDVARALNHE